MLPTLPDLSSPGASAVSDELAPVLAPMKHGSQRQATSVMLVTRPLSPASGDVESVLPLKFFSLGLMGYTQALAGPFVEGEQLL